VLASHRALNDQPGAELRELRQRLARVLTHPHRKQPIDLLLDLRRRRYKDSVRRFAGTFLGEGGDARDPLANPLYADLTGLGPIYIQVGGDETLLDDARRLDEHARRAGVDVRLDVFPDMLHTFQVAAGRAPEADEAIRRMADWVRPKLGLPITRGRAGVGV
jgi:acetyl esterase/lipase